MQVEYRVSHAGASGRRYLTSVRKCTPNVYGGDEIGTGKKLSVEFWGKFCKFVDI